MKKNSIRRFAITVVATLLLICGESARVPAMQSRVSQIDRDLTEATIAQLQSMYASGKYTVTQVTQWHLDRIARYDGVYKALLHVDSAGALALAATEDAAKRRAGSSFKPVGLWGVPIVAKANTSVKGL